MTEPTNGHGGQPKRGTMKRIAIILGSITLTAWNLWLTLHVHEAGFKADLALSAAENAQSVAFGARALAERNAP